MLLNRRTLLWPADLDQGPGFPIRARADWTDVAPTGEMEAEDVRFLLVHHTAGSTQHDPDDVPRILEGIRAFHVQSRGWPDIAYNFLIDRHGGIWEGRAGSLRGPVRGDATGGNQGFSQLVCLIGDFTADPPTDAAMESLVKTLAWLADRYDVDFGSESQISFASRGSNRWPEGAQVTTTPVAGHRDMSHTACPGDALYPLLASTVLPRVRRTVTGDPTTTTEEATTTTTEPPTSTTDPPTTSADSTDRSSTTVISSAPSSTSVPMAAPVTDGDGLGPVGWSLATVGVGLLTALLSWRVRRMQQDGAHRQR